MEMTMDKQCNERRTRICRLNDLFRCQGIGRGSVVHTDGVHERGPAFVMAVVYTVRTFNDFGANNDPYGEHDFGAFEVDGERLFFKLDYYNLTLDAGSPDPTDPEVTHRVLTIMLASEY
jgi:Protein of unknown function (DUF3768)